MKAIILTHDDRSYLANLTISSYSTLWKNNEFTFLVPYNNTKPKIKHPNVELIKSPKSIRGTIKALLDNIDDNEFVYWCMDDLYLFRVYNQALLEGIYQQVANNNVPKEAHSIRLIRKRYHPLEKYKEACIINGLVFHKLYPWKFYGFWFHSFVRCWVLRKVFLRSDLPSEYDIGSVNSAGSDLEHNVFLPKKTLFVLGETSRKGKLTRNCIQDAKRFNVQIPDDVDRLKYSVYNNRIHKDDVRQILLETEKRVVDDIA